MNIRKLIRETLEIVMSEMEEAKPHFQDRIEDRLDSEYTTFSQEKQVIRDIVFDNIKFLKKVNIDTQDNIGILVFKGPNKYISKKTTPEGKIEYSEGNFVWVIVRGGVLETVILSDFSYRPKNTQIHLTVDRIRDYIENENNGNFNLTKKDLNKLISKDVNKKPVEKEKNEDEFALNIGGVNYIVDSKSETIFKKNKPQQKFDIYNALEDKVEDIKLSDEEKDKVMSFLISENLKRLKKTL